MRDFRRIPMLNHARDQEAEFASRATQTEHSLRHQEQENGLAFDKFKRNSRYSAIAFQDARLTLYEAHE